MAGRNYHLHNGKSGTALAVRVTCPASKNQVEEILNDGTIEIRLKASPVENQTNLLLIDYLSEVLDVPNSKIEIIAGHGGMEKLVSVLDITPEAVHQKILEIL